MSAPRDLDGLLQSFLKEGPLELPDPSYDQVRGRMEQTRQRAVIGPWRTSDMNRYLKVGLAAAAAVLIAVVGFNLLPGSPAPGGEPSVSPSVERSVEASVAQPTTSYVLTRGPVAMTVTLPASGWSGEPGSGILQKGVNGADPPDGAGMIVWSGGSQEFYVYGDPCKWSTTKPETPATTVDAFIAALAAQASRDASAPIDITLDGYAGKAITLHVPDDLNFEGGNFTECDDGNFESWGTPGDDIGRKSQGPGQIDEVWALNVDGALVVIDWAHFAGTPQAVVDELRAIVESTTFE